MHPISINRLQPIIILNDIFLPQYTFKVGYIVRNQGRKRRISLNCRRYRAKTSTLKLTCASPNNLFVIQWRSTRLTFSLRKIAFIIWIKTMIKIWNAICDWAKNIKIRVEIGIITYELDAYMKKNGE